MRIGKEIDMAWITTKDGKHINTDWFDKENQIARNKAEADKMNGKSNRLSSKESEDKLRKELQEKLSYEGDYTKNPEYAKLHDAVVKAHEEKDALDKRMKELWEIEKKGSTIDEETLREFGGDRQLAALFATKSPEAEKAGQELKGIYKKQDEAQAKWESATNKLRDYEDTYVQQQKEALKKSNTTASTKVKDDYKGFQKDTATSYLEELRKKGDAYIVEMSPKEYLQRCATDIFDSTYERQVRAVLADAKHTYELADMMASGTKMYMPSLNYKEKGQEGRHRAAAAILNGIERIPVLIVPERKR